MAINDLLKLDGQCYGEPWYVHNEQCWYIHGRDLDKANFSEFPGLLITETGKYSHISLKKIDIILDWFANNYSWSILPWTNAPRFQSFLFISREQQLRDKFVKCSSNYWNISLKIMSQKDRLCNLLIRTYDVSYNFSDAVNAILFEENIDTVDKIWDACNCEIFSPYFLTNINFHSVPFLNEYLEQHKAIKKINIFDNLSNWNIYELQVEKKIFFELISSELISKSWILSSINKAFWVSQNTDFSKLKNLLINTESGNMNYSDLSYLQNFIDVTEWLYTFRRDFGISDEYNLSLFISRNSKIIQEIDFFRQEKNANPYDLYLLGLNSHYDLLGCF